MRKPRRSSDAIDYEKLVYAATQRLRAYVSSGLPVPSEAISNAVNLSGLSVGRTIPDHSASANPEMVATWMRLSRMWNALATADEQTRTVFLMHRIDGFTHEYIARRLNIRSAKVEQCVAKAITIIAVDQQRASRSGTDTHLSVSIERSNG